MSAGGGLSIVHLLAVFGIGPGPALLLAPVILITNPYALGALFGAALLAI